MRRRDLLALAVSGAVVGKLIHVATQQQGTGAQENFLRARVRVNWEDAIAQSTPFTFGSNDYEITLPEKAADTVYQQRLAELGIGLIRIHFAGLSDRWGNPNTKSWDAAKIKAGYDASFPQKPTIVQNIPGWPQWMAQNQDGLLDPSEYDRYAAFCAELVDIINRRQQRNVLYWEPLNEQDVRYEKAGKLDELWKLYNQVAIAMKAKDPRIQVGGPALTWDEPVRMGSFLAACRPNIDFISWHRYGSGDAKESTDQIMSYTPNYGNQVRDFRKIAAQSIPDRKVPLLLGEYNINYSWQSGENRQNTHVGAVWFASVLKHLADAGIDMATSWHLKDGIYGLIDPENKLRPAATVFAWGVKYLTGSVLKTDSDNSFIEALAVAKKNGDRSLLLINKSAQSASITLENQPALRGQQNISSLGLGENGVTNTSLNPATLNRSPLKLDPYSLLLLRLKN